LYADELKKADQKPFIDQLNTIAAMTMTKCRISDSLSQTGGIFFGLV
jgi:hypothetical protein